MESRSDTRLAFVAPVRIYGLDTQGRPFNDRALSIDISLHGARIEVINRVELEKQTIGVRYGTEKGRYRVVWVGRPGSNGNQQVGLYCADPGAYIWDVIPSEQPQSFEGAHQEIIQSQSTLLRMESAAPCRDRRVDERVSIAGSARLRNCETNAVGWVALYDLSRHGCYLETRSPWPVGSHVELSLDIAGVRVQAKGRVITSHPLVGMGLCFVDMSRVDQQKLAQVFGMLEKSCAGGQNSSPRYQNQLCGEESGAALTDAVTLAQLISRPGGE